MGRPDTAEIHPFTDPEASTLNQGVGVAASLPSRCWGPGAGPFASFSCGGLGLHPPQWPLPHPHVGCKPQLLLFLDCRGPFWVTRGSHLQMLILIPSRAM